MTLTEIEDMIKQGITDADVKVSDPMHDGTHLSALIISPSFEGQTRVSRHRMVYAALGDAFDGPIHALQMQTLTPEEAENRL